MILHSRMPLDPPVCSLETIMPMANGIPLGCLLLLPVDTAISVQTLKVKNAPLLKKLGQASENKLHYQN